METSMNISARIQQIGYVWYDATQRDKVDIHSFPPSWKMLLQAYAIFTNVELFMET